MTASRAGGDDRARLVQALFERALDLPPEARAKLLAEACGDDRALRAEVDELFSALGEVQTNDFLPPLLAAEAVAQPPERDLVGTRVHNYEVIRHLAGGGMGAVYLARHTAFDRQAALKVLHSALADQDEMVRRFLNEARAANAIRHPNIIDVFDSGRLEGSGAPYLLMEYLPGESLGARLRRQGRMPAAQAVAIAREIASALSAAHAQGIIHRDLKPENVFLVPTGPSGTESVKVLDFGIAKLRRDIAGTRVTKKIGAGYGTPAYMAPEQCRDFSSVDQRTDVYALGVMLYEMIGGRRPFESDSVVELIILQLSSRPAPPLRERVVDLPAALEDAVMKALAKHPAERFASMKDLEAALAAPDVLPPGPRQARLIACVEDDVPPPRPATRRLSAPVLGMVGLVAAVLLAAVGFAIVRASTSTARVKPAAGAPR